MFLTNRYTDWYWALIHKVQSEGRRKTKPYQYDRHHIIPKCFGGKGDENLVLLTRREHYIAHLLLIRMTIGIPRSRMVYALFRFGPKDSSLRSSKAYERWCSSGKWREAMRLFWTPERRAAKSEEMRGKSRKGVPWTQERRATAKIPSTKGISWTPERKAAKSLQMKGNRNAKGKILWTPERKEALSSKMKGNQIAKGKPCPIEKRETMKGNQLARGHTWTWSPESRAAKRSKAIFPSRLLNGKDPPKVAS